MKRMKRIIVVLLLVVVFIVAGYILLRPLKPRHQATPTVQVQTGPYDEFGEGEEGWRRWHESLVAGCRGINRELAFNELKPPPTQVQAPDLHGDSLSRLRANWGSDDPFYR